MRQSRLEVACWVAGLSLTMLYGAARVDAELGRHLELARFSQALEHDDSSWSESRRRAYRSSLQADTGPLAGTVTIPSVRLEVPLFGDTSEVHLNRGVGLIEGMAAPAGKGNLGIAGHRDGFFRALKHVRLGDTIEVRTREALYIYRVSALSVVDEADARLLTATREPVVTLVTCYPFYFVGHAPQRFVVRGELTTSQGRET